MYSESRTNARIHIVTFTYNNLLDTDDNNFKYLYCAFLLKYSKRCVTHTYKVNSLQTNLNNIIQFKIQINTHSEINYDC